jgi:hypothetical protein
VRSSPLPTGDLRQRMSMILPRLTPGLFFAGHTIGRRSPLMHGIHQFIVIGLTARTCIEATFVTSPSSAMRSRW